MAQFQRGNKKSLERRLGIMYGSIGAQDTDPCTIRTLDEGSTLVTYMVKDGEISEKDGEHIYNSMKQDGLFKNIQEIANHILSLSLPEGLTSNWKIGWGDCGGEDCEHDHLVLINEKLEVKATPEYDNLYSIIDLCDGFFQDEMMSIEEATWTLQQALKKISLEDENDQLVQSNN